MDWKNVQGLRAAGWPLVSKSILLIHYLFAKGQAINYTYYFAVPNKVTDALTEQRPAMIRNKVLFHIIIPRHTSGALFGKSWMNFNYRLCHSHLFTESSSLILALKPLKELGNYTQPIN